MTDDDRPATELRTQSLLIKSFFKGLNDDERDELATLIGLDPKSGVSGSGRTAPVQGPRSERGTISWEEHVEAWEGYAKRYPGQSAERIAERGGFGLNEIRQFLGRDPLTYRVTGVSREDSGHER